MNRAIKRQAFRELLERLLSNSPAEAIPEEEVWEGGMLLSREEAKGLIKSAIPRHRKNSAKNAEKAIPPLPNDRPRPDIPPDMRPPFLPGEGAHLSASASLVRETLSNSFFTREEAEALALKCAHFEKARREEGQREYCISIDNLTHHQRYAAILALSRAYPDERMKLSQFGPEEGEHAVIHMGAPTAERRSARR